MIVWNEFSNDARVLKEAETLQAAGHRVTVFALRASPQTPKTQVLESGVEVMRVPRSRFRRQQSRDTLYLAADDPRPRNSTPARPMTLAQQLLRVASRSFTHAELLARMVASRPAVVHAHDVNTLPTAWLAAVLAGAPLVYDAHEISTDREGYGRLRRAVGWVEKHLMPRAAATITTTDARARFFARAYGVETPVVLQNRPRLVAAERSDRIRRELDLPGGLPIVLYQGGLQPGRGLERLVEAAGEIENACFVFIGGGHLAGPLQDLAHRVGAAERVRFIPTVPLSELPSYTASADIGVQPIENTCLNHLTTDSNKLFEYVMAGLPVVASNLPEIRRIVNRHDLGILVRPGDTGALTDALRSLVDDPALRARFGDNARRAAAELNWDEQEQKLVRLYAQLLDGRGRGDAPVAA